MATPLPPVPNTVRIRVSQTLGDDLNLDNIWYATYDPAAVPLSAASVLALANAFFTSWHTNVMAAQCTALTLNSVTVTDLQTLTAFEETSTAGPVTGANAGAPVTAGACMVVSLRTALRGRSFRGRTYLAAFPASEVLTPQTWQAAAVTAADNGVVGVETDMETFATPLEHAVVSYYSGTDHTIPGHRPKPIRRVTPIATEITAVAADTRIGSQRRRNL
jgi:hypothetical protein